MNNKKKLSIWGREFDLDITLQNFPDEEITEQQMKTEEMMSKTDFSASLESVKQYILKKNASELDKKGLSNIFRFVMPKQIIIPRSDDNSRVFAIECKYKLDLEHGLAIVFENESFKSVGTLDSIL